MSCARYVGEDDPVDPEDYAPVRVDTWNAYWCDFLALIGGFITTAILGSPGFGKSRRMSVLTWLLVPNYTTGYIITSTRDEWKTWDKDYSPTDEDKMNYLPPGIKVLSLRKDESDDSSIGSREYLNSIDREDTTLSDTLRNLIIRKSKGEENTQPILLILDDVSEHLKERGIRRAMESLLRQAGHFRVHLIVSAQIPMDIPSSLRPLFRYIIWLSTGSATGTALKTINEFLAGSTLKNTDVKKISGKLGPDKTCLVVKKSYTPVRDLKILDRMRPIPGINRLKRYNEGVFTKKWMGEVQSTVLTHWEGSSIRSIGGFEEEENRLDRVSSDDAISISLWR